MRVAVLLHGRFANFRENFKSLLRAIGYQHEVDIFYSKNSEEKQDISEFLEVVKPVAWVDAPIEYDAKFTTYKKREETKYHNTLCMLRNRERAWKLFEEKRTKDYDMCVSIRADVHLCSDFDLDRFHKSQKLFIPFGEDHGGYTDQVAVGPPEHIKTYLNVYENLTNILDYGMLFHPEFLLLGHIHLTKTPVERFGLLWDLVR
jgi:hypothetical protein